MGKVHPQAVQSCGSSGFMTCKQESFTLWMKSLVLNGRGCTLFDSNGQIVYRVDNYSHKSIHEVHLMDQGGTSLFSILRKQYSLSRFWEGYRSRPATSSSGANDKAGAGGRPSFQVHKTHSISSRGVSTYKVKLGQEQDKNQPSYSHKIQSSKSACKIYDQLGVLVAELKRKKTSSGVELGDDVLTMVVEPNMDLSLIMGLVVAYSLIDCKM